MNQSNGNIARIRLTGELDVAKEQQLAAQLEAARTADSIIIDLTDVTYIDSSALRCFVKLKKQVRDRGRDPILLFGLRPALRRLFEITNLDGVFVIANTAE